MDVEVGDFEHEFVVEELYAVDVAGVGHDVAVADDVDVGVLVAVVVLGVGVGKGVVGVET